MDAIRAVKRKLPEIQLIAGNVATYEGAHDLISLGIDGLKVGIGPGSICTTRVVTGAGVPQITAILEASRAAKGSGVPVIADGGIKYSGDITQSDRGRRGGRYDRRPFCGDRRIARRNNSVSRAHVQIVPRDGFAGRDGSGIGGPVRAGGRSARKDRCRRASRAACPTRGRFPGWWNSWWAGCEAAWATAGAANLKELQENSKFIRISSAGLRESHVHDVIITREAPNYRVE